MHLFNVPNNSLNNQPIFIIGVLPARSNHLHWLDCWLEFAVNTTWKLKHHVHCHLPQTPI